MIKSTNLEWGFYGTISRKEFTTTEADYESAFHRAALAVQDNTGLDETQAVTFLDGRPGRHLADDIDSWDEIESRIEQWALKGWITDITGK